MAVLEAAGETSRLLLELEHSEREAVVGVHWRHLTLDALPDAEIARVQAKATAAAGNFRRVTRS